MNRSKLLIFHIWSYVQSCHNFFTHATDKKQTQIITTQALHISSSASCARVAAAPGSWDEKRPNVVEKATCDFVPLVMETFDVRLHLHFKHCTLLLIAPQQGVVPLLKLRCFG